MSNLNLVVKRKKSFSESIVGEMFVNGKFLCYTLELPWFLNQEDYSCIPPGRYSGHLRYDGKNGWRIQLNNVRDRTNIQIHIGNYPKNTQGCILIGMRKGPNYVGDSGLAMMNLQTAFYGTDHPTQSPNKAISVQIGGVLSKHWGDYVNRNPRVA